MRNEDRRPCVIPIRFIRFPVSIHFYIFFLISISFSSHIFIDCGLHRNKETIRRHKTSNEITSDGNKLLNKCQTVNLFFNSFGFLVPIHHLTFNADVSFVNTFLFHSSVDGLRQRQR